MMGTSCHLRFVQKGTTPVRWSMMPGMPMPMAFTSSSVWPLSLTADRPSVAMSWITEP